MTAWVHGGRFHEPGPRKPFIAVGGIVFCHMSIPAAAIALVLAASCHLGPHSIDSLIARLVYVDLVAIFFLVFNTDISHFEDYQYRYLGGAFAWKAWTFIYALVLPTIAGICLFRLKSAVL